MYSVFDINFTLELTDSKYANTLIAELEVYKNQESKNTITITDDWSSFDYEVISQNPKQHFYYKNTILIKDKLTNIAFVFDADKKVTKVYFKLNYATSFLRRNIRKWLNMQFTNRVENIGQIFHENVLIPLSFFYHNLTPIHAAGISKENKSYLLGGTGGVGKTTIELEQCFKNNHTFITDDIAVVNKKGEVYLNHNHPKIYGYNLEGNPLLKKKLFKEESFLGKTHWSLHKKIFGLDKVRRKISPSKLYNHVLKNKEDLNTYYILSKQYVKTLETEVLTKEQAIQMSISVLLTEYQYFFNHLYWHEFNAISNNENPLISVSSIVQNWTLNMQEIFNNVETVLVKIPINISHVEFKSVQNKLF